MNLFFVSSESEPFVKTGSLGEFVYSYIKTIAKQMNQTYLILPYYKQIKEKQSEFNIIPMDISVTVQFMNQPVTAGIYAQINDDYTIYFIEKDEYYKRDFLYSMGDEEYPDNAERIIFFNQAALELMIKINPHPEIVHCVDWQTGLIPVYIKHKYQQYFQKTRVIYTINNILYQGLYSQFEMPLTNLNWDLFTPEKLEYYGKINFLKGGIVYSDAVVFPSPQYSIDVTKEEHGCGLHLILQKYKKKIRGIISGMDNQLWNPESDSYTRKQYNLHTTHNRSYCKEILIKKLYNSEKNMFFIGMVSRLNKEKGIYFLLDIIDYLANKDIYFILAGSGDDKIIHKIEKKFASLSQKFKFIPDPPNSVVREIFSSCDILLKPPYQDPGGLSQLYAMRYGALPFASHVSGLKDTIIDIFHDPNKGNGFFFDPGDTQDFIEKFEKIVYFYTHYKDLWKKWQLNSMLHTFEMKKTVEHYIKLYESLIKED